MDCSDWVKQWLRHLQLSDYADAFKGASIADVKLLTETQLKQLGMKLLERRSFLCAAAKLTDLHTPSTSADREGIAAVCRGDADAGDEDPTESVLIEALKLEDQLRTSAEGQTLFRLAEEQYARLPPAASSAYVLPRLVGIIVFIIADSTRIGLT